ncbi:GAF domain-containing SpoIIE family protein phosphatase [Actinokineospora sp. NBRC 105648]|uniref:PP2C family protein-serine/threonine phosphatase n=1 Tax=Actinokineospora sp. NBRC 105648 TaxID=3032206 RepID=UPI0024A45A9B|nr:GAF domain-containing SpoIIE family protein phosphatase [Actinokineospora sp. NBRC 105648]GLZ37915.1 cyclic diguanylate phosphodiesterase [Actinokineospora sp. NBRC 105648]
MSDLPGAADRMSVLEAITDVALRQMELDEFLAVVLQRVRELFEVDTATAVLYDPRTKRLAVAATAGIEEEVRHGVTIGLGEGFAGRVALTREPVVLDRVDETTVVSPLLWRKGLRALLGVPMLARGELIGVLHVGSLAPRAFTDTDSKLLHLVADRVALTVQAEQSGAERAATTALQRSLLPASFPVVDAVRFAARYVPGAPTAVGGDWYDVFALHGNRLGVVIGDVAGHGLAAAVIMGRLRSALRAYALDYDRPAEVLGKLHRKVSYFEHHAMATVSYGVIDLTARRITLSSAGHPPPVHASPDHPAVLAPITLDPPVGLDIPTPQGRHDTTLDLPDGSVLVFYTDGLVERRGHSIDVLLDRLTATVVPAPPDAICVHVMDALIGAEPANDDVALLVIQLVPDPSPHESHGVAPGHGTPPAQPDEPNRAE